MGYNKWTEMATDEAKPWINKGGPRNDRGIGKQPTYQTDDG